MPELAALNIPIRTTGARDAEAAFQRLDAAGTRTAASTDQAANRIAGNFTRITRASGGLDAIQRRTQILAEGLQRVSTRAQSMVRLESAERQLKGAIDRGNLGLEQRIRLERELTRVQAALATQRSLPAPVVAMPAPTGVVGKLGTQATTALTGFAAGFAGAAALQVVTRLTSSVTNFLTQAPLAADELEAALRKLNATSRLTGQSITDLRATALGLRDQLALDTRTAVDFTAAVARMGSRAGDTKQQGAFLTAWLDLAAANGMNAVDALQALNTTIIGQDEGLNRLGLSNPQQIYEQWARAAGTTATAMTDAQKAQAVMDAVITVGSRVVGEYAKQLDSSAGRAQQLSQSQLELNEAVGGLLQPARDANNEFLTGFLKGTKRELEGIKKLWDSIFGRLGGLKGSIQTVLTNAANPALPPPKQDQPLPDLTVSMTPEEQAAQVQTLTDAIRLGTANNAVRRQAIQLAQMARQVVADETIELARRNVAAATAKAIDDAFAEARKGATEATRALNEAQASEIANLADLLQLETPIPARWERLRQILAENTAALASENLALADRVRLLRQNAAIEQATGFGEVGPFERMKTRGPDIARTPAPLMTVQPVAPNFGLDQLPGGSGSLFAALVKQVMADGTSLMDAVQEVQDKLAAAAQQLAGTFQSALVAGIADAATGGNIGEILAGITATMLSAIGEMAIEFGLAAIGIGALMEKIMTALASLNPIVVIAAGAALVALGAALRGAAQSSFGGTTASGPSLQPINQTFTLQPTSTTSAPTAGTPAAATAAPTFHFTLIGADDPTVQRGVMQIVKNATARGLA